MLLLSLLTTPLQLAILRWCFPDEPCFSFFDPEMVAWFLVYALSIILYFDAPTVLPLGPYYNYRRPSLASPECEATFLHWRATMPMFLAIHLLVTCILLAVRKASMDTDHIFDYHLRKNFGDINRAASKWETLMISVDPSFTREPEVFKSDCETVFISVIIIVLIVYILPLVWRHCLQQEIRMLQDSMIMAGFQPTGLEERLRDVQELERAAAAKVLRVYWLVGVWDTMVGAWNLLVHMYREHNRLRQLLADKEEEIENQRLQIAIWKARAECQARRRRLEMAYSHLGNVVQRVLEFSEPEGKQELMWRAIQADH